MFYLDWFNLTDFTSRASSCECINYKFRLTPVGGNFGEARQMCQTLGGDLISKNLGPEGKDYHGYDIFLCFL